MDTKDLLAQLLGLDEETKDIQRAVITEEITGNIERRFCLIVCMLLTDKATATEIIGGVVEQARQDVQNVPGSEEARLLLGEDVFEEIVDEVTVSLLKMVQEADSYRERRRGRD